VKPSNAPEAVLPIEVRVWDFAIPQKPHIKTAFAIFPHEISAWYGNYTDEIRRDYYAFLLEHRLNPTNIYTPSPLPDKQDMPFCVERGLNAFCLVCTWNKDEKARAELAGKIRDYEPYLKEKGWWDMAYIYGFDEIPPEKYGELRDMYGWVKKEFPDLPRMCTVVPNKDLKGYVDIWVPLTANYDPEVAKQYIKDGDEVWWYVCCTPGNPYPNFFIDYPAIDPRILFWMSWKYRVPGFLYYAVNIWENNRSLKSMSAEAHPFQDWNPLTGDEGKTVNGDGQLIYPGPNGKPLSSIRLEAIRDGIEDYEYFYILDGLVTKAEKNPKVSKALTANARNLLAVRNDVVKSPKEYTLDPMLVLSARREVAETIEKLEKALGAGK
jgi:hypothetical protein